MIASCKRGGAVRKLVFTSSASVVFDGSHLLNASEDLPYCSKHIDAYNESKVRMNRNSGNIVVDPA